MSNVEKLLREFGKILEKESNNKVKKAMQLFIKVDDIYKRIVLHGTGFSGEITAKRLRDHFDTLDLMDGLDQCIEDMEYELNENHIN